MDKKYTIEDLLEIFRILRGENGCPWDRVQTHESIKKSLIEETYEALDALESGNDAAFANELGDVLLQVAFHATLAKERGAFCFDDVLYEVCTKLITRHTHVFGNDKAGSEEEALGTWEKNKKKEKGLNSNSDVLKDVPHGMPSLMRAQKIQKKAASFGVELESISDVTKKICASATELEKACDKLSEKEISARYGELLFETVRLGKAVKADAEVALTDYTNGFIRQFEEVEKAASSEGKKMEEMSAEELEKLWKNIKKCEKSAKKQ